jgi:glutaminyl-tRNA synthetase
VKDASGEVIELRCTYDPVTRGGSAPDGRSPKATLHWVSAAHAEEGEVRLYDHLFTVPDPGRARDLLEDLNPRSEDVLTGCKLEPGLGALGAGTRLQLERLGYFCVDPDSGQGRTVLNRTVTLRDTWARVQARDR